MNLVRTFLLGCLAAGFGVDHAGAAALWNTAYYPGWTQTAMPATNIDFSALTHVIHFALLPNSNGTLDSSINVVTPANSASLITNAHAHGVKALISVGGAGSSFAGAASPAYRPAFISNLVQFTTSRGYDGIDVDWEPLVAGDASNFTNLINGLRAALNATNAQLLLTAATASQPGFYAAVKTKLDQINLMTYDLSAPWPGWITWFNSPLHDGGTRFTSTGGLVPSIDGMVKSFLAAGVPASKLGVGVPFYGYIWSGGTGTPTGGAALPRQNWSTAPTSVPQAFHHIMTNDYQPARFRWDTNAQVPYLTLDNASASNDKFISYDDETSVRAKVRYASSNGLGGVMIWELSQGWRADLPAGQRDPLLKAMKQALAESFLVGNTQRGSNQLTFQFSSVPGRGYRVQSIDRMATTNWQTLANLTATGASTVVRDSLKPGSNRFYRVTVP